MLQNPAVKNLGREELAEFMEKSFRLITPLTVDQQAMEMTKNDLETIEQNLKAILDSAIIKNN